MIMNNHLGREAIQKRGRGFTGEGEPPRCPGVTTWRRAASRRMPKVISS